ncbi:MAG: hypothetical protein AAF694_17450 [Bacteroidota bacterium]
MSKVKVTLQIPHLQREMDVQLPKSTTGKMFYEAVLGKLGNMPSSTTSGAAVVWELIAKHAQKKVYPDGQNQTLEQLGIREGETIIMKKDMDPGSSTFSFGN